MHSKFYSFAENFMKIVAVLFTALIFACAFFFTGYNYELTGHKFDIRCDYLLVSVIGILAIFALGFLLYSFIKRNMRKRLTVFMWIVVAWYILAGLYLAFFGRSMPDSDCWVVYAMSKSIAAGDLSLIHPTASYMSYYPQQIGICSFLAVIIRLLNIFPITIEEFHFIIAAYAVFEGITVFFLYKTVDAIWNSDRANFLFLFLSIFNFPYIMYSSYLYGEIPALMFFSIGAYFLALLFSEKGRAVINIPLCIVAFTLSVFVRKNTLVLIIGVVIALFFSFVKTKRYSILLTAVIIAICSAFVLPMTVRVYEKAAGSSLTTGVTAKSYIAMGMMESGMVEPGWYNGFNYNTFEQSDCKPELANEVSAEKIQERLNTFKSDPKYAWKFYKRKFLSQWTDGTYSSRESTHTYYGDRSRFVTRLYSEEYGLYYIIGCNIVQTIVFGGSLLWALCSLGKRKKGNLWKSFLMIGIFGGFLFHMLWEANSRYILTYAVLLLPYAAKGYAYIFGDRKI